MGKSLIVNVLGCSILSLSLSGCLGLWGNDTVAPLEIRTKPVKRPALTLPNADQLDQRDITWVLVTPTNHEEVFESLKKTGDDLVVFGLTGDDYGKLGLNISDIRMYIGQQQAIISAYKNYYIESEKTMDKAVTIEE